MKMFYIYKPNYQLYKLHNNLFVHPHLCFACGCLYEHEHKYLFLNHRQYKRQCPNKSCTEYHQNKDKLKTKLLTQKGQKNTFF